MKLNAEDIKTRLINNYGLTNVTKPNGDPLNKVYRLQHESLSHYLHIKLDSKSDLFALPLIQSYRIKQNEALNISGVTGASIYNSSAFNRYPDLDHNKPSTQKPGLCFDFANTAALDAFMALMFSMNSENEPTIHLNNSVEYTTTEKMALAKIRLGQSKYRQDLINYWQGCSVTGCTNTNFLLASHIKPWSVDEEARLDVYNGLLLSPTLDLAFDKGLISFDDDGLIMLSPELSANDLQHLHLNSSLRLRKIESQHQPYLEWHRTHLFKA